MDLSLVNRATAHHLWPRRGCAAHARVAASIKAKKISGSYILQANRARYNQYEVDASCPLCGANSEDLPHFLIDCPILEPKRGPILKRLCVLLASAGILTPTTSEEMCRLILNSGYVGNVNCNSDGINRNISSTSTRYNTIDVDIAHKIADCSNRLCKCLNDSRSSELAKLMARGASS